MNKKTNTKWNQQLPHKCPSQPVSVEFQYDSVKTKKYINRFSEKLGTWALSNKHNRRWRFEKKKNENKIGNPKSIKKKNLTDVSD